jgi:putative transposase
VDDSGWEPDGITLQVRFCEGGGTYRVIGIPAATLQRVIGTIRRECLDWLIPMSEAHLRSILKSWVEHYNRGRPHSSLGPGVPDPPSELAMLTKSVFRHRLAAGAIVLAKSVLGGLHHEYSLATAPAGV